MSISESSEENKGLAEPFKKSATGSAHVQSAAGLTEPDKSAPKGLADPSKAASKSKALAGPSKPAEGSKRPQSIPVRRHTRVTMGGAWVDADGVLNPRPPPDNKPPVPLKNRAKVGERFGKGYNDPVRMHNRFAALEDMEVEASKSALPRSWSGSPPLNKK